jgi:uncharacterized protein (TIGR00375 family)
MDFVCDLHIHSKFSGGTSQYLDIANISQSCKLKGIDLCGTGDCLHRDWLNQLKKNLIEYRSGIYFTQEIPEVKFILQTEIEVIWKYNDHIKKVHFILLFPNFEVLDKAILYLSQYGDLNSDGRPKIYYSASDLILDLISINKNIQIIPAHIFTPFFGLFGTNTHFNTFKEAVGDASKYINIVESGLSADPALIRCNSKLDGINVISNSDAHSANYHRIGREATVININRINYKNVISSLNAGDILKTYEFKPSGGRYFYDGHRKQRHNNSEEYFCSPSREIEKCPYCGKQLTKGVLSRIYELKDQENHSMKEKIQYIVPLLSLIKTVLGGTEYSKKNLSLYKILVSKNDGEYNIWNGFSNFDGIPDSLINAIYKIRAGKYWYIPGYDGCYGKLCTKR